jgi:hypothetical protein
MPISGKTIAPQARHRKQRVSENAVLGGSSKSHSRTLASWLHIYSAGIQEGSKLSSSLSLNELDEPKPSAFNSRS